MRKINSHFLDDYTLIYILLFLTLCRIVVAQSHYTTRDSLIASGDSQFRTGNFESAENIYKKILKIDAYDTLALQRLGRISYLEEDWGKSKDYFGKILEKYESNSNAHYNTWE